MPKEEHINIRVDKAEKDRWNECAMTENRSLTNFVVNAVKVYIRKIMRKESIWDKEVLNKWKKELLEDG